jgi:SAM-dependent methyltransferase
MNRLVAAGAILATSVLLAPAEPLLRAAQQTTSAPTADEMAKYSAFGIWLAKQAPDLQSASDDEVYSRYSAELRRQGKSDEEAKSTIATLRQLGDRGEIERWNRVLTNPNPTFNTAPNAFLVEMIKGVKPGRSLDVGMGQGRNTIFLAQQGWDSAGFDPADRAVAAAQEEAKKLGVKITTHVARAEDFDWGQNQWDLIVLSYVGAREYVQQIARALKPGGMVVIEAFHRDATKAGPIGGDVVFDTNELPKLFETFRIVRYEDTNAKGDFGLKDTRVVRLAAVKP